MNSKNIETTVAEIDFRIGQLQDLRGRLVAYDLAYAPPTDHPAPVEPVPAPAPVRRKYKPRRTGMPPLDVTAKAKPGRKPKPVQTPEQAAASVEKILGTGAPTTFAGACKRVLREAPGGLTLAAVIESVSNQWPDLCGEKNLQTVASNLTYWTSKGYAEKVGSGSLATFRVLDKEFFKENAA